ncbi:MAG: DUF748 domain-containing protein [Burkholderiales bacterium]|nr:DUF748 domain-containing protein [Burkholderiales bacterium]
MTDPASASPTPSPSASSGSSARAGLLRLATRVGAGLAVLAGAWTVGVGHWLPDWLRPRIEAIATEALGTPVTLGQLAIRPWSLTVEAGQLAVGPAGQPWFTLQQAQAQLSLESVWRLAPVLSQVTLVRPQLTLERLGADRFNISPVIERLSRPQPEPQPQADAAPARFAVFNITLSDGSVRYLDRVLDQSHRIEQLRLQVPFVSSLPSDVDVHVQPLLQARIDGSEFKLTGQTLPFKEGLHSELQVRWQAVDVAHWLQAARPLLPPELRPDPRAGRLDTDLTVVFEQRRPPALPLLAVRGSLSLDQLDLSWPQLPGAGRVDAAWQTLRVSGLDAQPLARQARVGQVALEGAALKVRPAAAPGANAAASASASVPVPASPTAPTAPWQWSIDQVRVGVREVDAQTQPAAPWPRLGMRIELDGLDARAQAKPAQWRLQVSDEHDGRIEASGQFHPVQLQGELLLKLSNGAVAPWLSPIQAQLSLPMVPTQGRLGLDTHVRAVLRPPVGNPGAGGLFIDQTRLTLADVLAQAGPGTGRDRLQLRSLGVEGIEAEAGLPGAPGEAAGLRRLQLASVVLDGLDAAVSRDRQGRWLGQAPAAAAANRPGPSPAPASPPITLAELRCQSCAVRVTDQTVQPAGVFTLQRTDLSVKNLSSNLNQVLNVALQTQAQGKGRVTFNGDVRAQPLSVKGALSVAGLDLRALQPYLDPHVNVTLGAAAALAQGRIQLQDDARAGLKARFQGKLGLQDLRVRDRVNDALFLRWASLTLDSADLGYANGELDADLGFIALKDFYGRVIVNPDGKLNLAGVVRQQGQLEDQSITTPRVAGDKVAPAPAPAPPTATATAATPPQLRWQGIHLEKGEVDFTDTFIQPNYSARLTRITGDISAVSSRTPEPATVEVSGAVDDGAPLRISGRLHPLGPRLYTDIQGVAKGIELTRLTPYSARYAGYAIEKGTLSVTVRYKVDGGKLEADNAVFLDQLTFGERVDSPDATSLPVRLAVSLLQNSRGEIDVNLPISGSLDDPQFSVGGIVWKVIVNLLTKAVTAPFALLTGGGSSELGTVPFEPGVAVLSAGARERLDSLIAKLKDRPGLKLEATGWADPDLDNEGLRLAHVEALMRRAKARATGQDVNEVVIEAAERPQWLKAAYQGADIKKPRNLIGLAQSLPDEQMAALLKASATVNPAALVDLADHRADVVKAYLVERMAPERVLLTASKVAAEGQANDKSGGASVQFNLK